MMLPAELLALAQQLLYDCCDPVTGESLYPGQSSYACVEDVEAAALYLRACAEAEPVATVRVHDTGGNAGIAWTGVPTENSCVMRGGTPLYTHPQPKQADAIEAAEKAEPVAYRVECRWAAPTLDQTWRKYADYGTRKAAESSRQTFADPGDIESRIIPLYAGEPEESR